MTDFNHREELGTLFKESQSAIAKGDLEALAEASAEGLEAEIDALVAELPHLTQRPRATVPEC